MDNYHHYMVTYVREATGSVIHVPINVIKATGVRKDAAIDFAAEMERIMKYKDWTPKVINEVQYE